jgi:hypothetical protein
MKPLLLILAFVATAAAAQEDKIELKPGPGRDKAMVCATCHSLDYIPMNSRFLDLKGWTAEVTKMKNVYGGPIAQEDVGTIANYLAENYGKK